jgi:hypothetical protein
MKKLLFWLTLALITLFLPELSHAQSYIPTITSTGCIGNGAGDVLASGTLIIVGTDQNDNPIPYRVNSSAQAITSPISRTITNGALVGSLQLANPALTSPLNVLYRIAVKDNSTNKITVYKQVIVAANSGSNFDLCLMNTGPSFAPVTVITNPGTVNGNTIQNGDFTINGRDIDTKQTITFSATPTFDCSSTSGGSYFKITLTGNVTSSTLSNCSDGQNIALEICQDATGSRTFAYPANLLNGAILSASANTCTLQMFKYDGGTAKATAISTFLSGDVNQGGNFVTVLAVHGVTYPASPSTHSVPVVTASNTITYKVIPDCQAPSRLQYTQSSDSWTCTVPGVVPNKQFFTSSGTFTIPSGVTSLEVYVTGAGGAGGGATTTTNASGTGGGGGGTAIKWLSSLTPGNTLTVTIGTGGTGVANAVGNGGTSTTLASGTQTITTLTGGGGAGGANTGNIAGGLGGGATNGDINLIGGQPDALRLTNSGSVGGFSYWGAGGNGGFNGAGSAASNCGGGGGGAGGGAGGTVAGGSGANGCVLIKWYTVQ